MQIALSLAVDSIQIAKYANGFKLNRRQYAKSKVCKQC